MCVPVISVSVSDCGGLAAEGVKEQGSKGGAKRKRREESTASTLFPGNEA